MLSCCNKTFKPWKKFRVFNSDFLETTINFGYCPHCGNGVYRENRILYNGKMETLVLMGKRAEEHYQKAKFNRLSFIERLKQGSKGNMTWKYIDGKIDNWVRDFNGVKQFQIDDKFKLLKA